MRYQLPDGNVILADQAFVDQYHPGAIEVIEVVDTKIAQRAAIQAQLDSIDAKSNTPRARREAALGNTAWLATLDVQAATLRTELGRL